MSNNSITWRQVGVVTSIIGLLITGGFYTSTKADKKELEKAEARVEKKLDEVKKKWPRT